MAHFPVEYGTSPVGRLIMGDPWNKQTKDQNGRELALDKQRYFFGIAVEKANPEVNAMMGTLHQAAAAGYAANPAVMQQIGMGPAAPQFSWKIQDGDEMATDPQTGQPRLRNKHAQGCWIFKFSTTIEIKSSKFVGGAPQFCDPAEIKRGFYVQVSYSTTANGNQDHTAGIYLNPKTICLVGFGEEIVGGPSLEQQFGAGPGGYVPAGMSATPMAPTGAPAPGMAPPAPGMAPPAPGMAPPAPGMAPPAPGMAPPAPGMAPGNPAPGAAPMMPGGGMPAPSMPAGATGAPTDPNQQPQPYNGYMNPQG